MRDFVHSLARISEAVFTPGAPGPSGVKPDAAEAKARLGRQLATLRTPPLAYVPLCKSSAPLRRVVRIPADEVAPLEDEPR